MFGFSEDDVAELLAQGIKPWDPEARAALAVLNGEDYYDEDEYDDDGDDDFSEFARNHFVGKEEKNDIAADGERALQQLDADAVRNQTQGAHMSETASEEAKAAAAAVAHARQADAEKAKAEGNALVASKDWTNAKLQYSAARKLQPLNHVYHSNYAMVCLELARLGGNEEASLLRQAEKAAAICVYLAPGIQAVRRTLD